MGGKKAETEKSTPSSLSSSKATAKWPVVKPKKNLQISRLKDTDLFTVRFPVFPFRVYITFCSLISAKLCMWFEFVPVY